MGLFDSCLNLRDACLTSERFHRFAERFPLTRPIVRKRQSEIFDIVSGFVHTQILLACVELNVFERIGSGQTIADLSSQIGLGVDETRRLVEGAASLRLLQKRGALYRLGDLGAALVATPGALAMIRHHPHFYRDLDDPVGFLQKGRQETNLSRFWDYAANPAPEDEATAQVYSELMATSQAMISREILAAYDFSGHQTLLDMGGGHGVFLRAVGAQYSHLKLQVFDLPAVASQAEAILQASAIRDRVEVFAGSFFDDALPRGADLISLVRILHDHDDAPAQAIVQAAYDALPEGGTLLMCEPMLTGGSAARISAAYFNFYLYAMGSGTPRSLEALQKMAAQAGFQSTKHIKTRFPLNASIVAATKSLK